MKLIFKIKTSRRSPLNGKLVEAGFMDAKTGSHRILKVKDFEANFIKEILENLVRADLIIGYDLSSFDIPFLKARLYFLEGKMEGRYARAINSIERKVFDLSEVVRFEFRELLDFSLENVCKLLKVERTKNGLLEDLKSIREIYFKLLPLIRVGEWSIGRD